MESSQTYLIIENVKFLKLFDDRDRINIMQTRVVTPCENGGTLEVVEGPTFTIADRVFPKDTIIRECNGMVIKQYWVAVIIK